MRRRRGGLCAVPALALLALSALGSPGCERQADAPLESVTIEGVPHILQKPDFCGEAAAAMYLQKLGHDVDQDHVFDRSGLDPARGRGVYAPELAEALERVGFDLGDDVWTEVDGRADLERGLGALVADLHRGVPSIVCMRYDREPNAPEHFRLMLGYDAARDELIYHEPAEEDGAYRRMRRGDFLASWPLSSRDSVQRFIVRMPLRAGRALEVAPPAQAPTAADFAQRVIALRPLLTPEMTVLVRPPFVVIGDEPRAQVLERSERIVELTIHYLTRDFFAVAPPIIDIWMFRGADSYRARTREMTGHEPFTPYGFYVRENRAIYLDISTGGGTLIHEMVHPYMEASFPDCPPWYNEGLGSLFEAAYVRDDQLVGTLNWRLTGLQQAIDDGSLPPLSRLIELDEERFYGDPTGDNYAAARYLLYYLQEHGKLRGFHHDFLRTHARDPSGRAALERALSQDLRRFDPAWRRWVLDLRPFPRRVVFEEGD